MQAAQHRSTSPAPRKGVPAFPEGREKTATLRKSKQPAPTYPAWWWWNQG